MSSVAPIWKECSVQPFASSLPRITPTITAAATKYPTHEAMNHQPTLSPAPRHVEGAGQAHQPRQQTRHRHEDAHRAGAKHVDAIEGSGDHVQDGDAAKSQAQPPVQGRARRRVLDEQARWRPRP